MLLSLTPTAWLLTLFLPQLAVQGQTVASAGLYGTVADPTGAFIPNANLHLSGPGLDQDGKTDAMGRYSFSVGAGTYTLRAAAPDFTVFTSGPLLLKSNAELRFPVRLAVAGRAEEISVGSGQSSSTNPDNNGSALVLEGDRLNLLSDDSATLQQQLQALAGPGLGPAGAQIFVDGFSGGRLPPKSSIRSIRINQNPFSAYNDSLGFGRVEIQTRPGGEKLHGGLNFAGTDQPFDAPNPYNFGVRPPFYQLQSDGNLNGSFDRKTSFFFGESTQQIANNAVVNAIDPSNIATSVSEAVPAPLHTDTVSLRLDRQFSSRNFAYLRDEWTQNHISNSGIAPLVLPASAFAANTGTNTLQGSDTQVFGPHAVNETRFQYIRTRARQDPNSTAPTVLVEGAFQNGGSPAQTLRDNQDRYELQDLFEFDRGTHSVRAGLRFRALRDAMDSSANFNGQFIFPYLTYDPTADGPVDNSYATGIPSQFNITVGRPDALLWNSDIGLYAEDDWKLAKDVTFSYGLRFESESAIPDHFDPAPRLGLAWAIHHGKKPVPLATLRAGYGIFYDRFPAANLLQAIRQNGTSEVAYLAQNPTTYPNLPSLNQLSAAEPTLFRVDPHLRSSYQQSGSLGIDRTIGRRGVVSSTLLYGHGSHEFLLRNVNAPLPGTYNPADPSSGTRPLATAQNIYQYSSASNENAEIWFNNVNLQITKSLYFFAFYVVEKQDNESDGSTSFASNSYNVAADYGRAANNHRQTLFSALIWTLPRGFHLQPFLTVHSGAPLNITTGTDLNGDTVYNDRPAFASDRTRASVVTTRFGSFDTQPAPGERLLPRNYATAPGLLWLDLQASKDFHIGPRPHTATPGTSGSVAAKGKPERLWDLKFQVEAQNLLNDNNPGPPIGVLPSPGEPICAGTLSRSGCSFFGHSLSLSGEFSPLTASNRTILVQSYFTF